jgi:light-dependent protochlorophyllide reductase
MQTVIITGGNAGLGYECAKRIATTGDWHVVIASRDRRRTEEAAARLRAETGNEQVTAMVLELASLAAVRAFAQEFSERALPPLRAIVCNAGIQIVNGQTYTKDGVETTFAVNHLGHYLLVHLLLPHLVAPARIVFVSSGTHDPAQRTGIPAPRYTDARTLAQPERDRASPGENAGVAGRRAYSTSKLCNVLCTYELRRRLLAAGLSGVTVNAFDPGMMPGSGLARDYDAFQRFAWRFVLPVLRLFVRNVNSISHSGQALARLVLDPTLAATTGKYFEGMKEIPSSKDSYDLLKAAELWETSAALVGISATLPPA